MERNEEITIGDLADPSEYIYIKVITAVSAKFKVGDHVKFNSFGNEDDDGNYFDDARWYPEKTTIESFRSNYWSVSSERVNGQLIYEVTTALDGYIEVKEVKHPAARTARNSNSEYLFSAHYIQEFIENMVDEYEDNTNVNELIDNIVENIVILDPDFADSIIMETEYVPYQASEDGLTDKLKEAKAKIALREKEIRSAAAKEGWERRRWRAALAAKQAKQDATNAKRAATIAAKKKVAKKVKKKASKK